jgi:hypothetical protein
VTTESLLANLVEVLDDELERIDDLTYRFVVLAALVAADQTEWIPRSVRELQRASEDLRLADLRRAAATSGVTDTCGLDPDARLEDIVARVDRSWGAVLADRRATFLEQVAGLQSVADLTLHAVDRRSVLAEEALSFLRGDAAATYGRRTPPRAQIVLGSL